MSKIKKVAANTSTDMTDSSKEIYFLESFLVHIAMILQNKI